MSAEAIARALFGRRSGLKWMARCPAHEDRTPSLSLHDANGRVLVHCHAGCRQDAVIAALRDRGLWLAAARRPWTAAELRAWARQRVADQRDLPMARWFARAAAAVTEEALESLPLCHERLGLTALLDALKTDAGILTEYRAWREKKPELTAAIVAAGQASDEQTQSKLARWLIRGQ